MIVLASGVLLFLALHAIRLFLKSLSSTSLNERLIPTEEKRLRKINLTRWLTELAVRLFQPRQRMKKAMSELPDFLELLSVALSSGESVYRALHRVVPRLKGVLATELKTSLLALEYGSDLESELSALAERLPQQQVIEMCNKLLMALKRGTPLVLVISEQAETVRQAISSDLMKQAGKNETRMLIPLVFLILPVTVLFAIYPSLQLLSINFL
jgi:tight adherence protein C